MGNRAPEKNNGQVTVCGNYYTYSFHSTNNLNLIHISDEKYSIDIFFSSSNGGN